MRLRKAISVVFTLAALVLGGVVAYLYLHRGAQVAVQIESQGDGASGGQRALSVDQPSGEGVGDGQVPPPPPPAPPAPPAPAPGSPEDPAFQSELLAEFREWDYDPYQAAAGRTIRQRMEDKSATPEDFRRLAEVTGEPADDRPQRDWLIAVVQRGRFPGTREEWRSDACRKMLANKGGRTFLGRYGLAVAAVIDAYLGVEGVNDGKPMGLLGACEHIQALEKQAGWPQ